MDTDTLHRAADEIERLGIHADYRLTLTENREDSATALNGEPERAQRAVSAMLDVTLLVDGRAGYYYTGDTRPAALREFLRGAARTTLLLQPDESQRLADPARYYKGGHAPLGVCDEELSAVPAADKLRLALEHNREARGADPRVISARTRYVDRVHRSRTVISNGFEGSEETSRCAVATSLTVDAGDGQHPMDSWGETRVFLRDLPRSGVSARALRRALRKIGQRPAASGRYRLIAEAPCAAELLQPVLDAMGGQALRQRASFLAGRLGERVGSPLLTLTDDPVAPGKRGAALFDPDGVATRRRALFDKGRLETYFIDTPQSVKLGMAPTTQGPHRLLMEPGRGGVDTLVRQSRRAILVTDLNGGNCDPSTGNFSYGVEGLLVEDGAAARPVSGMNMTGNMLDLWGGLSSAGGDADPWETDLIPSLAFEDVYFSGLSVKA